MGSLRLWSWVHWTDLLTQHPEREGCPGAGMKKPAFEGSWQNQSNRKATSAERTKVAKKNCQSFHNLGKIYSLKTRWNSILCACRKEQCWNVPPVGMNAFSARWQMEIGSGTHSQWKRHTSRWLLGKGQLIKLSCDDFRFSKEERSSSHWEGCRGTPRYQAWFWRDYGLRLLCSSIAFLPLLSVGTDGTNLSQGQNVLLNRTWVSPELILQNLGAKLPPHKAHFTFQDRHCYFKVS